MGYGSPPVGVPPCRECWLRLEKERTGKKDWSVCPSVHAEANAVAMAAKFGVSVAGASAYVTAEPCDECLRLLANAGVFVVVTAAGRFKVLGEDRLRSPMERGRHV
jgi:dCMP deaminase